MANLKFHYLVLAGIILLGGLLRFWHLDLKPLWLDEVITALFSLGRNYNDVPLDTIFSLQQLPQIFSFKNPLTCPQIAQNIATQSTHPPLFFCLIHGWVQAPFVGATSRGLAWSLRSLPALFGIGAIAAMYWLNTIAFSRAAGLLAAALIAVSPFAVYLSQEARHYTLPVLLIALSLVGLIYIQKVFLTHEYKGKHALILGGWIVVNVVGFYTHYFFILAFVAQVVTLCSLMYWQRSSLSRSSVVAILLSVVVVVVSFIPWLPILSSHFNRSETSWLPAPQHIAPIYQTLVSWVLMFVALPVENQPLWIAVPAALVMLVFSVWVASHWRGFKQLWRSPATQSSTMILLTFTAVVLLEFLAIVYFLGKDITIAPRYNFVYYPSFCALVAASLVTRQNSGWRHKSQLIILTLGLISCVFVVSNFVFQKPFNPQQVAQNINFEPTVPLVVVVGYESYQDVALGLSFALVLEKIRSEQYSTFGFFARSPGYESVWQKLAASPPPSTSQVNLWVVAPGLRRRDYPSQLAYANQSCNLDTTQHYRIGIPYQLYRCQKGEG